MFSNLRAGCQLYMFHVSAVSPYVEVGSVESVTNNNPMAGFYPNLPLYPIDVTVRIGDKSVNYQKLPANAESATVTETTSGETVVIATNRDVVNTEIQAQRQKSLDILNSVDYHQKRIAALDELVRQVNPEVAEKAKQQQEISELRSQLSTMRDMIGQLTAQLKGREHQKEKEINNDGNNKNPAR